MTQTERSYICGHIDAFAEMCKGCKVPSEFPVPTSTSYSEWTYVFNLDANGSGAMVIRPFLGTQVVQSTSIAGGVIDWNSVSASDDPVFTSIQNLTDTIRTVCWCIKVRNPQNLLNTQGMIYAADVPDDIHTGATSYPPNSNRLPHDIAEFTHAVMNAKCTATADTNMEFVLPGKRFDASSTRFRSVLVPEQKDGYGISADLLEVNTGWLDIALFADGFPASSALMVDIIHHYEYIPDPISGNLVPSTPGLPIRRAVEERLAKVASTVPVAIMQRPDDDESTVDKILKTVDRAVTVGTRVYDAVKPFIPLLSLL